MCCHVVDVTTRSKSVYVSMPFSFQKHKKCDDILFFSSLSLSTCHVTCGGPPLLAHRGPEISYQSIRMTHSAQRFRRHKGKWIEQQMRREMHSTEYGFTWKLKINKNKPRNLFGNRVSLVLFCFERAISAICCWFIKIWRRWWQT